MRKVLIIALIASVSLFHLSAALYSSSLSSNPSITMILSPMSTEDISIGFSSTDGTRQDLTPISGNQYLKLSYEKTVNSEITASGTYYPYWIVTGQTQKTYVRLYWTDDSVTDGSNSVFTLTWEKKDASGATTQESIESGVELANVETKNTGSGSVKINVSTGDLRSIPYGKVYTLKFTLKVETV